MSAAIITASECAALLAALVILLSMIVNVSALLIPAGVALAFAAKDLSHNFVAGAAQIKPKRLVFLQESHQQLAWHGHWATARALWQTQPAAVFLHLTLFSAKGKKSIAWLPDCLALFPFHQACM